MNVQDFSTYRQACDFMWYSDGLSQADVDKLPPKSRFHALYAPVHNAPQWHVVLFEIKTMQKIVGKGTYRAYVAIETVNLEYAPFDWKPTVVPYELPKSEVVQPLQDLDAEWLDYMAGAEPSAAVLKKLETLGSYSAA